MGPVVSPVPQSSVVVDVGGTQTRLALAQGDRLVGEVVRFATPSRRDRQELSLADARDGLLDRVAEEADRLHRAAGPVGRRDLGVAFGAVVGADGVIRDASVLWRAQSAGFDLRAALRSRLPWARVTVLNDVAAAAWHYRSLGRFALVTVSTGVAVKIFDDRLVGVDKVLADPAGLGGEIGHVPVEPTLLDTVPGGPAGAARLGRAAAAGDRAAQDRLADWDLPWCDCGAVADLCAYSSGPAVVRAAIRRARRDGAEFAGSRLHRLVDGDPARIDARALADAARDDDPFVLAVVRAATRHLAVAVLQVCAQLGLRVVVVVGGFAHGMGAPWFAALRGWLTELYVDAGWFQGWPVADRDGLLHVPDDAEHATLAGMAGYLAARGTQAREVVKPVGEARLVLTVRPWPRCGREQLLLRPRYAGFCGTDLQILRGERGLEPGVLGHECVAEVVEVGADVSGPLPGDLVTLNPNHPGDDYLKLGHNVPGVFRDVIVSDLGALAQGQVVGLPPGCGPEWVLLEPLAAVLRAHRALAGDWAGRDVLVLGAGVLALLHVAVARARGARTVTVAARSDRRLQVALRRGLPTPDAVLPLGPGLAAGVRSATAGRGAELAVIAVAGAAGPAAAELVWPALADGAGLHLFGGFHAGRPVRIGGLTLDPGPLRASAGFRVVDNPAGGRCTVVGTRGGRGIDFAAARDLLTGGDSDEGTPAEDGGSGIRITAGPAPLDLTPLVSHLVSLPALPAVATELLDHGTVAGTSALRVVVDFRLDGTVVAPAFSEPGRRGSP
ncbi:ROK family protein [Plantactinospora soyae]|uniref:Threonine dehydrogenase-like Zn-dependent dehydrogenase/predicted NBD/HSP70 family sugar kinase n=1 Tax=Plantactinospora soyae TaxID=1544732 RepID=A0A927LZG1_9ACTN|nr:ROK family protein [Plantactinospora soyae]MBE1485347.1 threonine dehydrogenase-like Zn-dependent dehydrogenase/predicted NBD/HSP70 family sugar kinase [Plantactinospora soyae]